MDGHASSGPTRSTNSASPGASRRSVEGLKLEFRAELFNFFNRTEFGIPANTINLPQTGQISTTTIPNRQVQFALKLLF